MSWGKGVAKSLKMKALPDDHESIARARKERTILDAVAVVLWRVMRDGAMWYDRDVCDGVKDFAFPQTAIPARRVNEKCQK
jgi:hypothetical protein